MIIPTLLPCSLRIGDAVQPVAPRGSARKAGVCSALTIFGQEALLYFCGDVGLEKVLGVL